MYITHKEYQTYGGVLDDTAFNLYGFDAEKKLDYETCGRIYNPLSEQAKETVKRCMVRITDLLARADEAKDKVTSWSNDGVSQSIQASSADDYRKEGDCIIRQYLENLTDLEGTPLLYLGGVLYD